MDESRPVQAYAILEASDGTGPKGKVKLTQLTPEHAVRVQVEAVGFPRNKEHGFHIHESGDISRGCESMGGHFNPENKMHGGREELWFRHAGDLGNLMSDGNGRVRQTLEIRGISLYASQTKHNVVNRGIVIHEQRDDHGLGGWNCNTRGHVCEASRKDSNETGNSGKRILCGTIHRIQ